MQEKAKEPEIRFAGFTGAWEQRKLGNLGETYTGLSGKSKEDFGHGTAKFITYMNVYSNPVSDPEGTDLIEVDNRQNTVRKGDVLFTTSSETPEEVGMSSVVFESIENTYLNSFCFGYRPKIEFNNFYLAFLLRSGGFRKNIIFLAQGISRYNISKNAVMNIPIPIPAKEEQEAIGDFFKHLDALLTLHQRKYEKLLNIKKSMLEKMFLKEGEVVPEIRFKGFTGAWEQRKLGELSDIIGGGTPSTGNSTYWDGNINWYSPAEISNQIFLSASQRKISELGYSSCSAKILPKGTVLFTSRAGIGKTAILAEEGCTNQGFQSIVPHTNELDSYFIFSRTSELKKYGEVVGAGSTFVEVSGKQMAAMTLMMPPSINEQKVIGSFFKRLDTLLTLHQRKLEMLKNVKQAFLEKMFV